MQEGTTLRMAQFQGQHFYVASSTHLSMDGQWHQWILSTLGRIEPPVRGTSWLLCLLWTPRLVPVMFYRKNHKTEDQEGSTRDVASSATYQEPRRMEPAYFCIHRRLICYTLFYANMDEKYRVFKCNAHMHFLLWKAIPLERPGWLALKKVNPCHCTSYPW